RRRRLLPPRLRAPPAAGLRRHRLGGQRRAPRHRRPADRSGVAPGRAAALVRRRYTGRLADAARPRGRPPPRRARPRPSSPRKPAPGAGAMTAANPVSVLLSSLPLDFAAAVRQAAALGFTHVDVVALADRPADHLEVLADAGVLVAC